MIDPRTWFRTDELARWLHSEEIELYRKRERRYLQILHECAILCERRKDWIQRLESELQKALSASISSDLAIVELNNQNAELSTQFQALESVYENLHEQYQKKCARVEYLESIVADLEKPPRKKGKK